MDPALLVRAARRQAGLSQRAMAQRAEVSLRALQALEAGGRPEHATVVALLRVAGLELVAVPQLVPLGDAAERYLLHSTSSRLRAALAVPPVTRRLLGEDLRRLGRRAGLSLPGRAAAGVWLRGCTASVPLPVVAHGPLRPGPVPEGPYRHLEVTYADGALPPGLVPVGLGLLGAGTGVLHVPAPLVLAQAPDCADLAPALRAVAVLLDGRAARDGAGRRAPAHRDPDEERELGEWRNDRSRPGPPPQRTDSRAWRWGGAVSAAEWAAQRRLREVRGGAPGA